MNPSFEFQFHNPHCATNRNCLFNMRRLFHIYSGFYWKIVISKCHNQEFFSIGGGLERSHSAILNLQPCRCSKICIKCLTCWYLFVALLCTPVTLFIIIRQQTITRIRYGNQYEMNRRISFPEHIIGCRRSGKSYFK